MTDTPAVQLLRAELRRLYESLPGLSYRRLSEHVELVGRGYSLSPAAISNLLDPRRNQLPRYSTVVAFVSGCARFSRTEPGSPDSALLDPARWEGLYAAAAAFHEPEPTPADGDRVPRSDPPYGRARRRALVRARSLLPEVFEGRSQELASLHTFALGEGTSEAFYRWIEGEPWAGKTTLAARITADPPPQVEVVSFFVVDRLRSLWDSAAFLQDLCSQLAEIALTDQAAAPFGEFTKEDLTELTSSACETLESQGRRMLLVIDGLDEDQSGRAMIGLPSIASLLPRFKVPVERRILRAMVTSRPHPPLPTDVDDDHQIRSAAKERLVPFSGAGDQLRQARIEIQDRLNDNPIGAEVITLLAAAAPDQDSADLATRTSNRGSRPADTWNPASGEALGHIHDSTGSVGLSLDDLSLLTGHRSAAIIKVLSSGFGSCLASAPEVLNPDGTDRTFYFAHQTLTAVAQHEVGPRDLQAAREMLHAWARDAAADDGWAAVNSDFLFFGYPNLLVSLHDRNRLFGLVMDTGRQEAMYGKLLSDRQHLLELHAAQRLARAGPDSDIGALVTLGIKNFEISMENQLITKEMCLAWARVNGPSSALSLAFTVPDPDDREQILNALVTEFLLRDQLEWAERAMLAISAGFHRDWVIAPVASALLRHGRFEHVETLFDYASRPLSKVQCLIDVATDAAKWSSLLLPYAEHLLAEAIDCARNAEGFDRVEGLRRLVSNVPAHLRPSGLGPELSVIADQEDSRRSEHLIIAVVKAYSRDREFEQARAVIESCTEQAEREAGLGTLATELIEHKRIAEALRIIREEFPEPGGAPFAPVMRLVAMLDPESAVPLIARLHRAHRDSAWLEFIAHGGDWATAMAEIIRADDPPAFLFRSLMKIADADVPVAAVGRLIDKAHEILVSDYSNAPETWLRTLHADHAKITRVGFPLAETLRRLLEPQPWPKLVTVEMWRVLLLAGDPEGALAHASRQSGTGDTGQSRATAFTLEKMSEAGIESGDVDTAVTLARRIQGEGSGAYSLARLSKKLAGEGHIVEAVELSSLIIDAPQRISSDCELAYEIADSDADLADRLLRSATGRSRVVDAFKLRSETLSGLVRGLLVMRDPVVHWISDGVARHLSPDVVRLLDARRQLEGHDQSVDLAWILGVEGGIERVAVRLASRGRWAESLGLVRTTPEFGVLDGGYWRRELATEIARRFYLSGTDDPEAAAILHGLGIEDVDEIHSDLNFWEPAEKQCRIHLRRRQWAESLAAASTLSGPHRASLLLKMLDGAEEADSTVLDAIVTDVLAIAQRYPIIGGYEQPHYDPEFGDRLLARATVSLSVAGRVSKAEILLRSITRSARWYANAANAYAIALSRAGIPRARAIVASTLMGSRYDLVLPAAAHVDPAGYLRIYLAATNDLRTV
jgi:hypothetical protein